jgi:hypothetical protein
VSLTFQITESFLNKIEVNKSIYLVLIISNILALINKEEFIAANRFNKFNEISF